MSSPRFVVGAGEVDIIACRHSIHSEGIFVCLLARKDHTRFSKLDGGMKQEFVFVLALRLSKIGKSGDRVHKRQCAAWPGGQHFDGHGWGTGTATTSFNTPFTLPTEDPYLLPIFLPLG